MSSSSSSLASASLASASLASASLASLSSRFLVSASSSSSSSLIVTRLTTTTTRTTRTTTTRRIGTTKPTLDALFTTITTTRHSCRSNRGIAPPRQFLFPSTFPFQNTNTNGCLYYSTVVPSGGQEQDSSMPPKYWNREESTPQAFSKDAPLIRQAKILSLSDPHDDANSALHHGELPDNCRLLAIGTCLEEFDVPELLKEEPNTIFVSHPMARKPLVELLNTFPTVEWVHSRSAGIDFIVSEGLAESPVLVTNAKGQFSSTLAEYTMMACSYFAKDLPRLMRQKKTREWGKYNVEELRGTTMGIIGYGDIGRACAKLAKVYGMKVTSLRRNPQLCEGDPFCDASFGSDQESVKKIMAESDYILCSAPLTEETRGMVNAEAFEAAKEHAVFINLGRGPVVDEDALIDALRSGRLKGAALDVFTAEPLPKESELWALDNVLISPHNMDQTATFMHEATEFFVNENVPRFMRGEELLNPVDKVLGY